MHYVIWHSDVAANEAAQSRADISLAYTISLIHVVYGWKKAKKTLNPNPSLIYFSCLTSLREFGKRLKTSWKCGTAQIILRLGLQTLRLYYNQLPSFSPND